MSICFEEDSFNMPISREEIRTFMRYKNWYDRNTLKTKKMIFDDDEPRPSCQFLIIDYNNTIANMTGVDYKCGAANILPCPINCPFEKKRK